MGKRTWGALALVWAWALPLISEEPPPPSLVLPRLTQPIRIDGDLSDPGWSEAAKIETFYETNVGDNVPPPVRTVAWVGYDDRFFYVAIRCDDPNPKKIRAPFVDRDYVFSDQDFAGIILDVKNDRRSAYELFVNPRGIQDDGIINDASGNEDFSPDLFWQSAGRIDATGWQVEMAIPLTSLRYPAKDPQTWAINVYRNYPRDFRYQIFSRRARTPDRAPCTRRRRENTRSRRRRRSRIADIARAHHRAAEPDAHRRLRPIEPRVVDPRRDHILDAVARHALGNQIAYQKPRDRSIAVGKMERVGAAVVGIAVRRVAGVRRRAAFEAEAGESRELERPHVERRDGVDADAPLAVGPLLVERNDAGIGLDHVQQVVAITHRGEARLLLGRRQPRHIIDRGFLDAHDVASHLWRQRRVGEQLRPGSALRHGDQLVGAKRLLVEKYAATQPERGIEIGVRSI